MHSVKRSRLWLWGWGRGRGQHWSARFLRVAEVEADAHGGQLVARTLRSHGVRELFALCGGHITPVVVAAQGLGIRVLDTRHEATAVFAADAAARLRQDLGVAVVTSGPGVTNTVTAVKNAQMAESPVVLIGGAAPTLMQNRGALQDIDQLSIFRPVCKHVARCTRVKEIVPTLKTAIEVAKSGTPGPVFIEFPIDILYPYRQAARDAIIRKPHNLLQRLYNHYVNAHINYQFHEGFTEPNFAPLIVRTPMPQKEDVETLAGMISSAKKPLLLLGSQSTATGPVKADELQSIVNDLQIPCYLAGMCRGLLGRDSPIQLRLNRRGALHEADLVILAGTPPDFRLDYGKILNPHSKVVAINRSKAQLNKNRRVYWNADHTIQADVASTLKATRDLLKKSTAWPEWLRTLKEVDAKSEARNHAKAEEKTADGQLNPLKLLETFDSVLPADSILIVDGGDFVATASYILRPRAPLHWLDPGQFGTLGVGGGFALGAKTVHPDKPVFIVYGDGSAGYSLMEFDSCVRQNLPVTAIVGNDACWTQIARAQIPQFKTNVACDLSPTHYEKTVESLGGRGYFIDKTNRAELQSKLQSAIRDQTQGHSGLVNVLIGKSDFRDSSISV